MKFRNLFFLLVFSFFFVGSISIISYLVVSGQDSFEHQIEDYLVSIISVNEERISDFILEMERDSLFLSNSDKTREIFKMEVGESEDAAKSDVDGKVGVIAKEVDNYIRAHPSMTLDDLKGSSEFQAIAVQQIGREGYSSLLDAEEKVIHFHIDSDSIGIKLDVLEGDSDIANILEDARARGFGEGYYDWVDINGINRKKYAEARLVGEETADGIQLLSITTSYIDDYTVAKNIPKDLIEHFKKFSIARDYHNVLFVSSDMDVIFMVNSMEGLGFNIGNLNSDLEDLYLSLADSEEDSLFYGPFSRHLSGDYLQVVIASEVYSGDEFLGVIMLAKDIKDVTNILEESTNSAPGFRDEDYLINEQGFLITPLKSRNVDLMVQEIRTDNTEECLVDFIEAEKLGISVEEYDDIEKKMNTEDPFFFFYDFKGDLTLGFHRPIGKVNWCLFSEINFDKILDEPIKNSLKKQITFRIWVFFGMTLLLLGMASFIDKRYILKRKKNKVFKENFFTRLGLGYYFLFAAIFITAYFFIVTSFFQGWQNAKLFDDIPDMLIFIVGFMIFAVGLKIKNMKARGFIVLGGLLICFRRMFDIPFQEYQVIVGHLLTPLLWVPVLIAEFTGFLLLLMGYRRLKHGI